MPLDDLVSVIETLQQRIRDHGGSLRQNETRTRAALIDPLLTALGWDVSDPAAVIGEYQVGNGRADYALLGVDGRPRAFVEAKHLGEPLETARHEAQIFTYALLQQVRYAGLTDGNKWVLDNVAEFSGGERRLLELSITAEPAYQCALKFLLLWRPNLSSGHPTAADNPLFARGMTNAQVSPDTISGVYPSTAEGAPVPDGDHWITLAEFQPGSTTRPPFVHLPDGTEKQLRYWYQVLVETAEWLIRTGQLTPAKCPIRNDGRVSIVHSEPIHASGRPFFHPYTLSNGLFLNKHGNKETLLKYVGFLLDRVEQKRSSIWLKPS